MTRDVLLAPDCAGLQNSQLVLSHPSFHLSELFCQNVLCSEVVLDGGEGTRRFYRFLCISAQWHLRVTSRGQSSGPGWTGAVVRSESPNLTPRPSPSPAEAKHPPSSFAELPLLQTGILHFEFCRRGLRPSFLLSGGLQRSFSFDASRSHTG